MTPFLSPEGLKAVQARAAELHQHLASKRIKRLADEDTRTPEQRAADDREHWLEMVRKERRAGLID